MFSFKLGSSIEIRKYDYGCCELQPGPLLPSLHLYEPSVPHPLTTRATLGHDNKLKSGFQSVEVEETNMII